MKTRDVIAFLLNLLFTGVFFAASGMSFQYYIWGKLGELKIYQMNFQGVLGFLDGYFNGNNVNYLFLNIALLMWLFIVFVTLYVIWIKCRRIHAYLRIGVATWLTLALYLAATSVIYFSFMLPYLCGMVSLSDVNEKRLVSDCISSALMGFFAIRIKRGFRALSGLLSGFQCFVPCGG